MTIAGIDRREGAALRLQRLILLALIEDSGAQPIYFDDTLASQFVLGISGGVEEMRTLSDGVRFIATCRPRNCEDKAAAVVDPDGRIVGAGMIGFRCRKRGDGVPPCDDEPSAFVFLKRTSRAEVSGELREWATSLTSRSTTAKDVGIEPKLEVTVLD